MTTKDRAAELLRKTPRQDAIDSINKAKAFKKAHSDCVKQFKSGKCSEQAAQTIINTLSTYH